MCLTLTCKGLIQADRAEQVPQLISMQSKGTCCVYQSEVEEESKQEVPAPHSEKMVQTGLTVSHQTEREEMHLCACGSLNKTSGI